MNDELSDAINALEAEIKEQGYFRDDIESALDELEWKIDCGKSIE